MIEGLLLGPHISAFGPGTHPAFSNSALNVSLQQRFSEWKDGCHFDKRWGNNPEHQQEG